MEATVANPLQVRLDELEKQLIQQERIRDGAKEQHRTAKVAVSQLQGACAMLRELLAKEAQATAPSGSPNDEPAASSLPERGNGSAEPEPV
jgi:hypothetical protein